MQSLALIRCDGSHQLGMGHVYRCLVLAKALRSHHHFNVIFAIRSDSLAENLIRKSGFHYHSINSPSLTSLEEEQWLSRLKNQLKPSVIIFDIRTSFTCYSLLRLKDSYTTIALLDDSSDRRLAADIIFYPPVPQVANLDWSKFTGICKIGWEWVLIRPEFSRLREISLQSNYL